MNSRISARAQRRRRCSAHCQRRRTLGWTLSARARFGRAADADGAGGLAEFERDLIRDRTGEGRQRAKDRGVKFGRKPKLNHFQRQQALLRLANGETQAEIARTYGVGRATISWLQANPLP